MLAVRAEGFAAQAGGWRSFVKLHQFIFQFRIEVFQNIRQLVIQARYSDSRIQRRQARTVLPSGTHVCVLSFIFFLLFTIIPDEDKVNLKDNGREMTREEKRQFIDSVSTSSWTEFTPKTLEEYDSIQNSKPVNKRDGNLERYFQEKLILLKQKRGWDEKTIWKSFGESLQDNIPKMIFFLLPIFALILKLLYIRRDFYYSEHLVFTVFFYDFLFLAGIFSVLFSLVSWLDWINFFVFLYVNFYLYKSMRRVYRQSRGKTILKFFLITSIFFFCILFAFVINALVTLILL